MKAIQLSLILVLGVWVVGCGGSGEEPVPAPEPKETPVAFVPDPEPVVDPEPLPGSVPEPEPEPEPTYTGPQSTPQKLVASFFSAVATNGLKELRVMSMPRIHSELTDPDWMSLWQGHTLSSVEGTVEELPEPNPGAEKTVKVRVVFQDTATSEVMDERLKMSFKGDRWYWDEK